MSRPPEAEFALRPLTTGQVLDRTFSLYRLRFWLFTGLAILPAAFSLISQLAQLWYLHHRSPVLNGQRYSIPILSLSLGGALLSFIASGLTVAATTWAVTSIYLGREATMQLAFRQTMRHWFRYVLVVLAQFVSAGWVSILLIIASYSLIFLLRSSGFAWIGTFVIVVAVLSFIYSFWRYLGVSLAMPACVFEDLKVLQSLSRSKALLPDRKGRIFLLYLLLFALYILLGIVVGLFSVIARQTHLDLVVSQLINFATSFFAGVLVGPIGAIALSLFYFDERVRREGFDVEYLLQLANPAMSAAAMPAADMPSAAVPAADPISTSGEIVSPSAEAVGTSTGAISEPSETGN